MDGAGRLARSLRSLGPQADLKAAAIGAVVLLCEWFASRRRVAKPVAKPRFERAPQPRLIATIERYLPNRIGVAATVLILLGSAGFGIVKGGHVDELTGALSDVRNALANSAGCLHWRAIRSVSISCSSTPRQRRRRGVLHPS